jgi:hypothetical protein
MLNRSKMMITAITAVSIASAGWMAGDMTARADTMQQLPLAGAPLVCAKGFAASGNQTGYTCKSEVFKCNAGLSILWTNLSGNRASYFCGKPIP